MRIAICNGERILMEELCRKLKELFPQDTIFYLFNTGTELLNSGISFDLVILDVDLPDIDGIKVKDRMEIIRGKTLFIFTAPDSQKIKNAFGVGVIGFMERPIMDSELETLAEKVMNMWYTDCLEVLQGNIERTISSFDILFVESMGKNSLLHLRNGEVIRIRKTLKKWEEELPAKIFFRVNRSYIVRFEYLHTNRNFVIPPSGEKVTFGRKNKMEFQKKVK